MSGRWLLLTLGAVFHLSACTLQIQAPESDSSALTNSNGGGGGGSSLPILWSHARTQTGPSQLYKLAVQGDAAGFVPYSDGEIGVLGPAAMVKSLGFGTGNEAYSAPVAGHRLCLTCGGGGTSWTHSTSWAAGLLPLAPIDPQAFQVAPFGSLAVVDASDDTYVPIISTRLVGTPAQSSLVLGIAKFHHASGNLLWNLLAPGKIPLTWADQESFQLRPLSRGGSGNRLGVFKGGDPNDALSRPTVSFLNPETGEVLGSPVTLSGLSASARWWGVEEDSQGRIVLLGSISGTGTAVLVRLTSAGALDASFGSAGVRVLDSIVSNSTALGVYVATGHQLVLALDGADRPIVAGELGSNAEQAFVLRVRADGAGLDGFTGGGPSIAGGIRLVNITPNTGSVQPEFVRSLFVDSTQILLGGITSSISDFAFVLRLDPTTGEAKVAASGVFANVNSLWTSQGAGVLSAASSKLPSVLRVRAGKVQFVFPNGDTPKDFGALEADIEGATGVTQEVTFGSATYLQPLAPPAPLMAVPPITPAPNGDWMVGDFEPDEVNKPAAPRLMLRRLLVATGNPLSTFGTGGELDAFAGPAGVCTWRGKLPMLVTVGSGSLPSRLYTLCASDAHTLKITAYDAASGTILSGVGAAGVATVDLVSDLGGGTSNPLDQIDFEAGSPVMIEEAPGGNNFTIAFPARSSADHGTDPKFPDHMGIHLVSLDDSGSPLTSRAVVLTNAGAGGPFPDRDENSSMEIVLREMPAHGAVSGFILAQLSQNVTAPDLKTSQFRRFTTMGEPQNFPDVGPTVTSIKISGVGVFPTAIDGAGRLVVTRPLSGSSAISRLEAGGALTALPDLSLGALTMDSWFIPGRSDKFLVIPWFSDLFGSLRFALTAGNLSLNTSDPLLSGNMDLPTAYGTPSVFYSPMNFQPPVPNFDRSRALVVNFEWLSAGVRPRYLLINLE